MSKTNTNGAVVWLVNEGGHDYTPLKKYGRIVPLTAGFVNPFKLDRTLLLMSEKLKLAKETDFLAISGLPILNGLAIALWLEKFPDVRLLQWSQAGNHYRVVRVAKESVVRAAQGMRILAQSNIPGEEQ